MAVADVGGALVADDRVSPGARAPDHEVVLGEVERLDRGGVERQQRPEGARGGTEALEERGVHVPVREPPLGALLVVHRGVDVGVRPDIAHGEEDALGAAQVQQEIVHERHAQAFRGLGTPAIERHRDRVYEGEGKSRQRRNRSGSWPGSGRNGTVPASDRRPGDRPPGDRRRRAAGPRDGAAPARPGSGPLPGLPPARRRWPTEPGTHWEQLLLPTLRLPSSSTARRTWRLWHRAATSCVIHDVAPLRRARLVQPALLRATSAPSCPRWRDAHGLVITVSEFSRGEIVSRARGPRGSACG